MDNLNLERTTGEALGSYLERLGEHISKLRWQSEGHRQWYTHKNPYGCWICELLQVSELLRDISVAEGKDNTEADEPGNTRSAT